MKSPLQEIIVKSRKLYAEAKRLQSTGHKLMDIDVKKICAVLSSSLADNPMPNLRKDYEDKVRVDLVKELIGDFVIPTTLEESKLQLVKIAHGIMFIGLTNLQRHFSLQEALGFANAIKNYTTKLEPADINDVGTKIFIGMQAKKLADALTTFLAPIDLPSTDMSGEATPWFITKLEDRQPPL